MFLTQCFSFLLLFSSLNLTEFAIPEFSYTYLGADLHNLTCATIDADAWRIDINHAQNGSTGFHLEQLPNTFLECASDLDYFGYHGRVHAVINMSGSSVGLDTRTTNDNCLTVDSLLQDCRINMDVPALYADPPSLLIDALLSSARFYVNAKLASYVCEVALPELQASLANHTIEPLTPVPPIAPGSTALQDTPLFRAAERITEALPLVYGVRVGATIVGPATLEVSLEFPSGKHIHYAGDVNPTNAADAAVVPSPEMWMLYLRGFLNQEESLLDRNLLIPYFPGHIDNSSLDVWIPSGARVDVHVNFVNFWCEEPATYRCFVKRDGGIYVSNLRVENVGDVGTLFMRYSRDDVILAVNERLTNWTNSSATCFDCLWFEIPMRRRAQVTRLPPLSVACAYCMAATVTSGLLMIWRVRRHRARPVLSHTGEPVTTRRLVTEDAVLCIGVFCCIGCFIWSNMTTAATVLVGSELEVYSFSLMSTAEDLWKAGLKPLSVCVFVFSGVYPYFKLISILVFTLVLQWPDAAILHVIDYLGKLSLLDTFVMIIMVSGLSVPGIADVRVFAPFYIFVAATVGSIALGNYATCIWRRGTSAKRDVMSIIRREAHRSVVPPADVTVSAPASLACPDAPVHDDQIGYLPDSEHEALLSRPVNTVEDREHSDDMTSPPAKKSWLRARMSAVGSCTFVLLCSLPAWLWPCLRYRLGGLAPLVTSPDKSFSLSQLAWATSPTCFVITLATVLIAPCMYALAFPRWEFLASWCAADALVVACVAGLLQLNQFVQFVLGPGMEDLYNAHAVLLWTLAPLTVAATFVWLLVCLSLRHPQH